MIAFKIINIKKLVHYYERIQFKVITWPWTNTVTLNKSILKSPAIHSRGEAINDGLESCLLPLFSGE